MALENLFENKFAASSTFILAVGILYGNCVCYFEII